MKSERINMKINMTLKKNRLDRSGVTNTDFL